MKLEGNHVMVDLETIGLSVDSAIISIGAVQFDARGVRFNSFYREITAKSNEERSIDFQTLAWWMKQSAEARVTLTNALGGNAGELDTVLDEFAVWFRSIGANGIWSKGAAFDIAMLEDAYRTTGRNVPWKHTQQRCFRTLCALYPEVPYPVSAGVQHNALADAKWQAQYAVDIFAAASRDSNIVNALVDNNAYEVTMRAVDTENQNVG